MDEIVKMVASTRPAESLEGARKAPFKWATCSEDSAWP
jgi:hypothetical protein